MSEERLPKAARAYLELASGAAPELRARGVLAQAAAQRLTPTEFARRGHSLRLIGQGLQRVGAELEVTASEVQRQSGVARPAPSGVDSERVRRLEAMMPHNALGEAETHRAVNAWVGEVTPAKLSPLMSGIVNGQALAEELAVLDPVKFGGMAVGHGMTEEELAKLDPATLGGIVPIHRQHALQMALAIRETTVLGALIGHHGRVNGDVFNQLPDPPVTTDDHPWAHAYTAQAQTIVAAAVRQENPRTNVAYSTRGLGGSPASGRPHTRPPGRRR